jgi:hypothetical protein
MVVSMHINSNKHEQLMDSKMVISAAKANKIIISNLKEVKKIGVINEEEFKAKIQEVLNL